MSTAWIALPKAWQGCATRRKTGWPSGDTTSQRAALARPQLRTGARPGQPARGPVIDQIFWAGRMHDLGVSPAPIPQGRLTTGRLAEAIRTATTHAAVARRAQELGGLVSAEHGTADAVAIIGRIHAGRGDGPVVRVA